MNCRSLGAAYGDGRRLGFVCAGRTLELDRGCQFELALDGTATRHECV